MSTVPSLSDLTLGAAAISALTYVATQAINAKKASKDSATASITLEQALRIVQENTEVNTKLATVVETQTRILTDLVAVVNRLTGRIEGRDS